VEIGAVADINEIIHQPIRLRIMSALFAMEADAEVDFTFLRDHLELTDGNLGAHLERLEFAGYLFVRKAFIRRKPRTSVHLTRNGRRAFEDYIEALKRLTGISGKREGE
jgi:DNA-binding MarR family transcriptional regulator